MTPLAVLYAGVGLLVGLVAAAREYHDGTAPGSVLSAGAVGLFASLFWPAVVIVIALGIVAHFLARLLGALGRSRR